MKRKCLICSFVGKDMDFFTKNKKNCDKCLEKKEEDKKTTLQNSKEKKKEYYKEWCKTHSLEMSQYRKEYYLKNKEVLSNNKKIYYDSLTDEEKEYRRELRRLYNKDIYQRTIKQRRENDPLFKLKCNLRNLIKNSLTIQGYTKKSKTYEIVGMTYTDFKNFIESKFQEGMTWENYGEWHLDHIIPVSSAIDEETLISLNYYTNFQPLWALDNLRKSNLL